MTNEELIKFLEEIRQSAREELSECRSSSYAAGYEKGRIDLVNEIEELLKEE